MYRNLAIHKTDEYYLKFTLSRISFNFLSPPLRVVRGDKIFFEPSKTFSNSKPDIFTHSRGAKPCSTKLLGVTAVTFLKSHLTSVIESH